MDQRGFTVHNTWIGPYLTTQEMAGFSITLFRLDDELARYLDQPGSNESFLKA